MYNFKLILQPSREAANLTQQELAVKIGVTRTYVNLLEKNIKLPSIPLWLKIAEALKKNPMDLVIITHDGNFF